MKVQVEVLSTGRPQIVVELTRRNLVVLLEKLDDPLSARTLVDGSGQVAVRAVDDSAHYSDRPPGEVYMPSRGEYL